MVCLGNICRSPLAEGILKSKVEKLCLNVFVDSAGTSANHEGELPDPRSISKANDYQIDITDQRSRPFKMKDFEEFDFIYVMDQSNYNNIVKLTNNPSYINKVSMIMSELHPNKNIAVPDPYYGGEQGFEDVYQMLDDATDEIIKKLK